MIPCEDTSGKRQRLGKLTKEGNSLLRYLWTEATIHAVRKDPELKRFYRRKLIQKGMGKARIAAAHKLLRSTSTATGTRPHDRRCSAT
jgi:transposase